MKALNNYKVSVNGEAIEWFDTHLEASRFADDYNSKNDVKCELTREVFY